MATGHVPRTQPLLQHLRPRYPRRLGGRPDHLQTARVREVERRRPRQHRRHSLVHSGTSREPCDLPGACRTQRPKRRDGCSCSSKTPQDQPARLRRPRVHGRVPPMRLQSALWEAAPWRQSQRTMPYTPPRGNRRYGRGCQKAVRTRTALDSRGRRPGGVCGRTARRTAPTRRNGRRRACKTRKPRRRDATTTQSWRSLRSRWCSTNDANAKKSWRSWRSWRSRSSNTPTKLQEPYSGSANSPRQPTNGSTT